MSDCNLALNAVLNRKEQPNRIVAHGSVMVFTRETQVAITKADPQGIERSVLLLRLVITSKPGPMKGMPRPFHYEEIGDHVSSYTHVQVESNKGDNCTIQVEILG